MRFVIGDEPRAMVGWSSTSDPRRPARPGGRRHQSSAWMSTAAGAESGPRALKDQGNDTTYPWHGTRGPEDRHRHPMSPTATRAHEAPRCTRRAKTRGTPRHHREHARSSTRSTRRHEAHHARHEAPRYTRHAKARGTQATQVHEAHQGTRGARAARASSRMTNRPIDPTMP
jgi:hypothetical protein